MSPQTKPKGSLSIYKKFADPVGVIRRRTGLNNPNDLAYLKLCLDDLWLRGKFHELGLFRDRKIEAAHVMRMSETKRELEPDQALLDQPLHSTLIVWLRNHYSNPKTLYTREQICKKVESTLGSEYKIRDAHDLLTHYKQDQRRKNQHSQFSIFRNVLLLFLKQNLVEEEDSLCYKQTNRIKSFTSKERLRMGRKNRKNPFSTPGQLDKLLQPIHYTKQSRLTDDVQAWIWFLCLTGIHRSEIDNGIEVISSPQPHFRVLGTKTSGRYQRIVPRIIEIPEYDLPTVSRFKHQLNTIDRSPYDCRRTFAIWSLRSGIHQDHVAAYLGHASGLHSQTSVYQQENILRWVQDDSRLLKDYLTHALESPEENTAAPVVPALSREELGGDRQLDTLQDIEEAVNNVLQSWYEGNYLRRWYMLRPNSLDRVDKEAERQAALIEEAILQGETVDE